MKAGVRILRPSYTIPDSLVAVFHRRLFGSDVDEKRFTFCSVHQGAGSALMERSKRFEEIVRGMKYVSSFTVLIIYTSG